MKRKFLSIFLSFALVFAMIPVISATAFASETTPNYLTFTALQDDSSVTLNYLTGENVQYKVSDKWNDYVKGTTISLSKDESVQFKGTNVTTNINYHFSMTGEITASGSVTSLTDSNGGSSKVLLSRDCYCCMFAGCTSLEVAPELPATELADGCYRAMFYGCTSLEVAPELPATELADNCYVSMFYVCTSLEVAPELPATKLAQLCYFYMFYGCTSLTVNSGTSDNFSKEWSIPANSSASGWHFDMLSGTASTLTDDPAIGTTYYIKDEAKIDTVSYPTVADALAAAKDGDTITLNYTCYAKKLSTNKRVTIDLNGNKLKGSVLDDNKGVLLADDTTMIDNGNGTITLLPSAKGYTYTADGNKITAASSGSDGFTVGIELIANNQIYNGQPYTGASLVSDSWSTSGLEVPTIMYVGRCGTNYAASSVAPTRLGKYTAYITVGDQTAKADFVIMTKAAYDKQQIQMNLAKKIQERISLIENRFAELHKSLGTWYSLLFLFNHK